MSSTNILNPANQTGHALLSTANILKENANITDKLPYLIDGKLAPEFRSQTKSVTLPASTTEATISAAIGAEWVKSEPTGIAMGDYAIVSGCSDATLNSTWVYTSGNAWVKFGSAGSVVAVTGTAPITASTTNGTANISITTGTAVGNIPTLSAGGVFLVTQIPQIPFTKISDGQTSVNALIASAPVNTATAQAITTAKAEAITTATSNAKTYTDAEVAKKQNTLTAGPGITISDSTISANVQFSFVKYSSFAELPTVGDSKVIYLVPKTPVSTNNALDEYIWIDGKYDLIGDTTVDLSAYSTTVQMTAAIATAKSEAIAAANAYTDTAVNGRIASVTVADTTSGLAATTNAAKAVTLTLTTSNSIVGNTTKAASEDGVRLAVAAAAVDATTKTDQALKDSKSYADTKDTVVLSTAKAYTDTTVGAIKGTRTFATQTFTSAEVNSDGILTVAGKKRIIQVSLSNGDTVIPAINYGGSDTTIQFFNTGEKSIAYGGLFANAANVHELLFAQVTI